MDIEKTRKAFKWDPSRGDYSKSYVSYERKQMKKKQLRNTILTVLYALIIIVAVILIYSHFD